MFSTWDYIIFLITFCLDWNCYDVSSTAVWTPTISKNILSMKHFTCWICIAWEVQWTKTSGNSSFNSICQFLPFLKETVNLFLPGNEVENLLGIQYCYLRTSLWQCLGFRQNNSAIPHYGYFQAVDSWNRHGASEITLILFLLYISKSSK